MERKRIRKNKYKKKRRQGTPTLKPRLFLVLFGEISLLVAMSVAFIYCHDFILQPGFFKAENLVVKGANKLSRKEVLEQAKIFQGINILSVNLSISRKRLLAHAWIDEAEIKREIPDGFHIKIKEHKPVAIVDLGLKYLMNTNGVLFIKKGKSKVENLPLVSGLKYSDIKIYPYDGSFVSSQGFRSGNGINPEHRPLDAVMEVLNLGLPPSSTIPNRLIKHIRVDRKTGLTIHAFEKMKTIKLGYDHYPEKYAVLKNIMTRLKQNKMKVFADFVSIDLNNLNRIVVKPTGKKSS